MAKAVADTFGDFDPSNDAMIPHGTVRYYRYPLVVRKGRHSYPIIPADDRRNTGPQAVLVPDYLDQVAPMRYCQIDGYNGKIESQDVVRHTTVYPFDLSAARFYSSNKVLNKVLELGKYTIKATSAFGVSAGAPYLAHGVDIAGIDNCVE